MCRAVAMEQSPTGQDLLPLVWVSEDAPTVSQNILCMFAAWKSQKHSASFNLHIELEQKANWWNY